VASKTSESAWLAPISPDVVWFEGADAVRFLNDLISREIGDLADGESRRSFLLEPQGKLQYILWVFRHGDRIGLVTDPGRGDDLASYLGRYRIRVDVDITVEEAEIWLVMGEWQGPDVSWGDFERHLVIGEKPDLAVGSEADYESARIESGEPTWGVDVDGDTIPHVSGLVPVSVDFDKGCFLGQELVARIDSRGGNVPRHLRLLDAGEGSLTAGDSVVADGKEVGTVTSAAGAVGLATVHRDVSVGDTVAAGGVESVVKDLPTKTQ
jgi:folate-binding protein YgfZ